MKFLGVALLLIGELAGAEVMLRVRPHVVVAPNSEVKLAQIVDAQGISQEGLKQLNEVSLSVAPADGEHQELAEASISSALRAVVQAERERNSQRVHLVVPKKVIIDTIKRDISEDLVTAELMQAWQPLCSDCKLEIEALSLPKVAQIRDWTMKVKAELPRGSFSIPVDIVKQNGALLPAWISGRLLTKKKVPVALRQLGAEERVQPKDIAWEFRDTSYAYDGIPSEDDLVGKKMKQGLRAGEVLWRGLLEKEKAIRRGDLVTVKSGEGIWEISMNVVAQQDAFIGDIVNLKHPKTNTPIVGQVTAQGEVELR